MWVCPKCGRAFSNTNQGHYCGGAEGVDQYIAAQAEDVQPVLRGIREVIRGAASDAVEKLSWQMPTFWQNGNLIHYAAFKKHVSVFPGAEAVAAFADTGRLDGYKANKGTIQFPLDKPIPYALIAEITDWCVAGVEGRLENIAVADRGRAAAVTMEATAGDAAVVGAEKDGFQGSGGLDHDGPKSNKGMDTSKMSREVYDIPDYVAAALDSAGLWGRYRDRPPYQRNDYIGWIRRGKREETREKRLGQMLDELRRGDAYMGMAYKS